MAVSRNMLKWIAFAMMVLDHVAAACLDPGTFLYGFLRGFGRISFPLFLLLFVEGFSHTKHKRQMFVNLLIAGLLADPFYDRIFGSGYFDLSHMNVMFTYLLGFVAISGVSYVMRKVKQTWSCAIISAVIVTGLLFAGYYLHVDFGAVGVGLIVLTYFIQKDHLFGEDSRLGSAFLVFLMLFLTQGYFQIWLGFLLYWFYPPERNRQYTGVKRLILKYWFYLAYPLHLAILCVLFR